METRRTVPVKRDVGNGDTALLRDTVDEFQWSANYVTRHAFEYEDVKTSKTTLHEDIPVSPKYFKGFRSLGSEISTDKAAEEPAWLQDLKNTTERAS